MSGIRDIALVFGTRPEMIKLAPIVHELAGRARIVHTGQHYDRELSAAVMDSLGIGEPHVVIGGIGGNDRPTQIGAGVLALNEHFGTDRPSVVVVQGDTNATLVGAMVANFQGIPLIHVEAGLRSGDRTMPEEINRLLVSKLATVHCAPTSVAMANLLREGIPGSTLALTGNTIVEAVTAALASVDPSAHRRSRELSGTPFALATIHRPENTDSRDALERVLRGLADIPLRVVFPMHPRTRDAIARHGLAPLLEPLTVVAPVDHSTMLTLAAAARLLVSDSGGVQEECTVLGTPLLVVRQNTERPEAVHAGYARLVTAGMDIGAEARSFLESRRPPANATSPFGDGHASSRIAAIARALAAGESPAAALEGVKLIAREGTAGAPPNAPLGASAAIASP